MTDTSSNGGKAGLFLRKPKPREPQPSLPAPNVLVAPRRPLSDHAAAVRQEVFNLETALEEARDGKEMLERRNAMMEQELEKLHAELEYQTKRGNHYYDKHTRERTKFEVAANILLDVLNDDKSPEDFAAQYAPKKDRIDSALLQTAMRAVETALQPEQEQVPAFLKQEPAS